MKTLIAALAAVTTVTAIAAPAAAQSYGRPDQGRYEQNRYEHNRGGHDARYRDFDQRQDAVNRRIEVGQRNGALSRREAAHLRDVARGLVNLEARYSRNGLSRSEFSDLNTRYSRLEKQIRIDRRDGDRQPG